MLKNTIDESIVFEINKNCSIKYDTIGPTKIKVVTVDNFYKNPDMVRQLALDIPASANQRIRGGNPAQRINVFYTMDGLANFYDYILRTFWPEIMNNVHSIGVYESFARATFMVNVMQSENLPPTPPHLDNPSGDHFASTIYLNTDEESAGGTSFYTFAGSDSVSPINFYDENQTQPITEYITDSVGDWKLVGIAPMKYNRMVLYNQNVLHTAYVKPDMFTNNLYRINQQFFI